MSEMVDDPVAAVAAAYARMAHGQDAAWISVVPEDEALARARELAAEGSRGRPLWGVPFAVKDNIDVAGMVTTAGCPAYAYTAERTAPAVQRLLDAGAVLVGKTNLDQFATGLVGTRSPYGTCHSVLEPTLISGGSSSGSAVAVAEGVVPLALGTDTAGSGRVPAAANGIVGLKPTRGLVSIDGVVPACRSIDCVSIFATTVDLATQVLDLLADRPTITHPAPSLRSTQPATTHLRPADPPTGTTHLRAADPPTGITDTTNMRPADPPTGTAHDEGQPPLVVDATPHDQGAGGDAAAQPSQAGAATAEATDVRAADPPAGTADQGGRLPVVAEGVLLDQGAGAEATESGPADPEAVVVELGGGARWQVGVPAREVWGLAEGQAAAYEEALAVLAGWTDVVEVDLGPLLAAGDLLYEGAFVAERLLTVGPLLAASPEALHPVVRQVVSRGLERTASELFADQQRLAELAAALAPLWDTVDVLACPTVPDLPTIAAVLDDPVGANAALGRWTHGVNLLDLCALTVPAGTRPDGLPGSLSLLGPAGADHRLATVARGVGPAGATVSGSGREVELAVVGAHLRGLPLHHQLSDRGARFVRACRTAPVYRLHALATDPPKPGMVRVGPRDDGGGAIEAEVWALDVAAFGDFVAEVPPPLTIGTVELEDGVQVKGFLCEPAALDGTRDITAAGSWRVWWAGTNRPATDGRPDLPPGTTVRRKPRSASPTSCPPPPAETDLGG